MKAEANTKVNETASVAPTEKANDNPIISEVPTSKLEEFKTPDDKREEIEGTLDADEFESLV